MRVSDNDQKDRESTKKENLPEDKEREESQTKAESQRMTRKRNTGAGKQTQNTGARKTSKTKQTAKKTQKQNEKERERELPWRRQRQTSEYPPSESQKTNTGDPTLSGAQKTTPEHTNRIEQTKANPKQRGNPVKRCQ